MKMAALRPGGYLSSAKPRHRGSFRACEREALMFQNPRSFSASVPMTADGQARPPAFLAKLPAGIDLTFVWRGRRWIVAGAAAGLLLAIVADLALTPRYRAVSEILIGPADLRVVDKSVLPAVETADANAIRVDSETRVITSDSVLRRVVESEHLTDDPEFRRQGVSVSQLIVTALRWIVALKPKPAQPV